VFARPFFVHVNIGRAQAGTGGHGDRPYGGKKWAQIGTNPTFVVEKGKQKA